MIIDDCLVNAGIREAWQDAGEKGRVIPIRRSLAEGIKLFLTEPSNPPIITGMAVRNALPRILSSMTDGIDGTFTQLLPTADMLARYSISTGYQGKLIKAAVAELVHENLSSLAHNIIVSNGRVGNTRVYYTTMEAVVAYLKPRIVFDTVTVNVSLNGKPEKSV
ncbi:MAG: hypothetical protein ABIA93_06780 [Candidatus Woesearchaeota archaeon]